jgi:orotate phosphoribosyltransferase
MTPDAVLDEFRAAGALREGHFVLSSGLHSPVFLQKNLVFMHARRAERLCKALAEEIRARATALGQTIELVVSPAVGAIIPGYETGRQLGLPSIFVEREEGRFRFRRGFHLEPGTRVVMVEDIVTTGLSSRECIQAIAAQGGVVVMAACIVDRSGGAVDVGAPLVALASLKVPAYPADALPPDLAAIPVEDPGSRRLKG